MKKTIYILTEAVADDDGNFYADVCSVHTSKDEATKALAKLHKEVKSYFEHPVDEYSRGMYYDINEEDDFAIRRSARIDKKEINV